MNRIRTAAAAVAMLVGAATVASAQAPTPQEGRQGQRGAKGHQGQHGMMADLNLSDTQKEQIKAIHAKYRVQFEQLRTQSRPDVEAARTARQAGDTAAARAAMARARGFGTQVAALRQQEHAEVRAVLNAEQRASLDARQAQMRERMAQRDSTRRARGAEGRWRPTGASGTSRAAKRRELIDRSRDDSRDPKGSRFFLRVAGHKAGGYGGRTYVCPGQLNGGANGRQPHGYR